MAPSIAPATRDDLAEVLPLFAGYQRFYTGSARGDDQNRAFLSRFLAPSDDGLLLVARDGPAGRAVGLANLYWTFSSTTAEETALLNDLFVVEDVRGDGIGRALVEASAAAAREGGLARLSWRTAVDNRTAQRLYERLDAERTIWFDYEMATGA